MAVLLAWAGLGTVSGEALHGVDIAAHRAGKARAALHLKRHPVVALTFDDVPAAGDLQPGQTRASIARALAAELRAGHLKGTYGFVNAEDLEGDADVQEALRLWLDAA